MKCQKVPSLYKILHLGVGHVGGLERLAERNVRSMVRPFLEIAHLDAVEGLPLPGLDEFIVDDGVGIPVRG